MDARRQPEDRFNFFCIAGVQGARQPGDIISERRATSSRNQRATSSATRLMPTPSSIGWFTTPIASISPATA
jgi:hypothetical protein